MKYAKDRIKLIHAVYGSVTCGLNDYYDTELRIIEAKFERARETPAGRQVKTLHVSKSALEEPQTVGNIKQAFTTKRQDSSRTETNHGELYKDIARNAEAASKKLARERATKQDQEDVAQQVWKVALERIALYPEVPDKGVVLNKLVNQAVREFKEDRPSSPISIPNSKAAREVSKSWVTAQLDEISNLPDWRAAEVAAELEEQERLEAFERALQNGTPTARRVYEGLQDIGDQQINSIADFARFIGKSERSIRRIKQQNWKQK